MTTYTATQLATRVLRDLGVVDATETPSAADIADATEIIGSEVEAMSARGIAIWGGSETALPSMYLTALSRRLGLAVGPSFGVFSLADAVVGIEPSEQLLRQISAKPPTGLVQETDYF